MGSHAPYVKQVINQYHCIFGGLQPKEWLSPFDKDDHLELDTPEELPIKGMQHYQSLIGGFQWDILLCSCNFHCAAMYMGRFCAAPQQHHLNNNIT
jgi:hypothetical protein